MSQSCKYGAECGLIAQCECECCCTDHECECEDHDFEDAELNGDFDDDEPDGSIPYPECPLCDGDLRTCDCGACEFCGSKTCDGSCTDPE